MKKKLNTLFFTGIPVSLPIGLGLALIYSKAIPAFRGIWHNYARLTALDIQAMIVIVVLVVIIIFVGNLLKRKDGKTNFIPFITADSLEKPREKNKAQHHKVPRQYRAKEPEGLTLGRQGRKFVFLPFFRDPEHQLIFGAPGSRKTSIILSALLWIFSFGRLNATCKSYIPTAVLAIDCKPELTAKSVDESRSNIRIINPTDYSSWGFDVWFGLDKDSTDDEIKERTDDIARALIPSLSGDNAHFSGNAQKILSGCLMYGFRKGYSFTDSIIKIMDASISNLITEIIEDPEMEDHPKILHKIKGFDGNDSDEFASIKDTLEKDLDIFDVETVQYCFSGNPNKVVPENLRKGISVFLSIPDTRLEQYKTVFGMILELCCKALMADREEDLQEESPIWCLVDEGGTIYIPSLIDVASRGRSKKIQLTVVAQSYSQLEKLYGHDNAETLKECCKTTVVLSCNGVKAAKEYSARAGYYKEPKVSENKQKRFMPAGATSQNISEEYRPVLDVSDITALEKNNEVLVFTRGDWFLVEKVTYKDIPKYEKLSARLYKKNTSNKEPL